MEISVLIIEDSVYSADLNVRMLKKTGFEVNHRVVASGKAMLSALHEKKWDLILSDNSMPNFEAMRALELRNSVDESIPFIIVSEQITSEEVLAAFSIGCDGFVPKKNLPQINNLVRKLLNIN